ncbi:MAG: ABC transporter ATP-binding protein [Syntrophales bacterium]
MIEAEGICKQYGSIEAVKDVSFKVEKGEVVGLLGPNGAGKTTTMRILACFIPPTRGLATVGGLDVTRYSLQVRRKIGYSMERTSLYPEMRVTSFLRFAGELKGLGQSKLKQAVPEVIELCGLEKVGNRIINNLSKGYRQRLGLAQALIGQPEVLILDEPTVGLDPENVSEIRQLIKGLTGERTVILSSHILSEVSMICSKVIIMNSGRIVAVDTPAHLGMVLQDRLATDVQIEGPQETDIEELGKISGICRVNILERLSDNLFKYRLEFEKDTDIYPALNAMTFEKNWVLREIQPVKMTLEDIFLKVVSKKQEPNG